MAQERRSEITVSSVRSHEVGVSATVTYLGPNCYHVTKEVIYPRGSVLITDDQLKVTTERLVGIVWIPKVTNVPLKDVVNGGGGHRKFLRENGIRAYGTGPVRKDNHNRGRGRWGIEELLTIH